MVKLVALLSFNGLIEKDISRHEISGEKMGADGLEHSLLIFDMWEVMREAEGAPVFGSKASLHKMLSDSTSTSTRAQPLRYAQQVMSPTWRYAALPQGCMMHVHTDTYSMCMLLIPHTVQWLRCRCSCSPDIHLSPPPPCEDDVPRAPAGLQTA